ncbi:hypothetical protein BSF41_47350 [Flavobacterium sp. ACN2]|uniref:DUF2931 family protein n=1 Tax=Flavobacterium sp. ACN2 TaxID=1975676 RepID=UPI000BB348BA|nr:DUF2931 family protein [Flavobacterium sp. ACN2]PBI82727.1 hypothetical protein BSF41_47350 [Flavobacterium sp. ACN2]
MYPKVRFFLCCFLIIGLLASCQPKDTFDWNAGISAPKNYLATPFVEYFYKGKSIAGTSINIGDGQGWGITMGNYVGGDQFKPVPDSVFVKWRCAFDLIQYEGGFKLPRQKMLMLFKKGVLDNQKNREEYSLIIAGTAPGGNITIWMQADRTLTEIEKFKAKKVGQAQRLDPNSITLWTSKGQEAKEILTYIYLHGVPYSVWEKGEKEYDYDVAFTSKESEYGYHMTLNSKDGSWFSVDKFDSFIPWDAKEIKTNKIIHEKHKSPVQLYIQWYTNEENYKERQWYDGTIILPQNFEDFLKTGCYNRLLVAIEKDNHKDLVEGKIMLLGKSRKKTIMKFRLGRYDYKLGKQLSPEYILPKDFVFPKWQGREPIEFPELDYWQEK